MIPPVRHRNFRPDPIIETMDEPEKRKDQALAREPKAGKIGESAAEKKGKRKAATKLESEVGAGKTIPTPPKDRERDLDRAPRWEPRFPGSARLRGKVAIVTGGDSGIGRAVSVLFAREGANLAIVYRDNSEDAEATAAMVEREGQRLFLHPPRRTAPVGAFAFHQADRP